MNRTLVLNATNQPLTVVPVERALSLVLREKVDVVSQNGRVFRSERRELRAPSIIRLRYYVHVPYSATEPIVSRKAVFARDKGICQYCGKKADNLDHVIPRAKGGKHSWDNLVAACRKCNSKKGDKTPEAVGMKLMSVPREPSGSKYYVFGIPDPEWETYLA